jgi:phosphohistidine phosphatase
MPVRDRTGGPKVNRVTDQHTVVLLRHAKSDYPAGVADHDRPLAPRGVREAAMAGDWLRGNVPAIDAVLCSTATRTRETLQRSGIGAPVSYERRLYGADSETMIDEIAGTGEEVGTLLVVGHEPTISETAIGLAGADGTDQDALERLSAKYPTSGIAVLRVAGPWAQLRPGGAALVAFHVPR